MPGRARLLLVLACALAFPCAAQGVQASEVSVFDLDGPAVRQALEAAVAAETGRSANSELAADLYCGAARHGSLEGTYRLGRMIMSGRGMPRDLGMAATLFSIASGNGHEDAGRMLLLTGVQAYRLPPCLAEAAAR